MSLRLSNQSPNHTRPCPSTSSRLRSPIFLNIRSELRFMSQISFSARFSHLPRTLLILSIFCQTLRLLSLNVHFELPETSCFNTQPSGRWRPVCSMCSHELIAWSSALSSTPLGLFMSSSARFDLLSFH